MINLIVCDVTESRDLPERVWVIGSRHAVFVGGPTKQSAHVNIKIEYDPRDEADHDAASALMSAVRAVYHLSDMYARDTKTRGTPDAYVDD